MSAWESGDAARDWVRRATFRPVAEAAAALPVSVRTKPLTGSPDGDLPCPLPSPLPFPFGVASRP